MKKSLHIIGLIERTVAAGFQSPPQFHAHEDTDWLCYILSGNLKFLLETEDTHSGPGDLIYLPRTTYFRWENPTSEEAKCLIIYTPGGFENFFRDVIPLIHRKADRIGDYEKTLTDILRIQDQYKMIRRPLGS